MPLVPWAKITLVSRIKATEKAILLVFSKAL